MSAPGYITMSSVAGYLLEQTPLKRTPPQLPEIPQGYVYVQDLENLKARRDEIAREWRIFRAPAVHRGRTLVFGMRKPREWNYLSDTDRTKLKRDHLVQQCGQENVWFEEDQLPRLDQPIVAFHSDYHAQFEVEDVPNSHEQYTDTSILIRSLRSEDLESFTAAESDRLAAAKFSRLLAYGRYEDWKKLLAIKIQREEAAKQDYERKLAQWQEIEIENAKIRGLAVLEARRQQADKERLRALQAQKATEDQRIRLLQQREADEREKQKRRAILERRQQDREQAIHQLTQFQLLDRLKAPAAPHSNMRSPQSLQPLSQQQRRQPLGQASQSGEQQGSARLLQSMRNNSIARDSSLFQHSTSGNSQTQCPQNQATHAPTLTTPAAFPPSSVRLPIQNSLAPRPSPPRDSPFAQLFKPASLKRSASSMSDSSDLHPWEGITKHCRGQSLERGQTVNNPEFNANIDMFQIAPSRIDLSLPTASVRTTKSGIRMNSNNALLFAVSSTLLKSKIYDRASLTPPPRRTKRPPTSFIKNEHRYSTTSHSLEVAGSPTPKRRRLCKSYRTTSISIDMERHYQEMIEKLLQIMKLHFEWAYIKVPAKILDHITVKGSLNWIANRLNIGDYGAARFGTVAEALQSFLAMDFNQKFEFVVARNIQASIQGDLATNLVKTKYMQSRALDTVVSQWEQLVAKLVRSNVST